MRRMMTRSDSAPSSGEGIKKKVDDGSTLTNMDKKNARDERTKIVLQKTREGGDNEETENLTELNQQNLELSSSSSASSLGEDNLHEKGESEKFGGGGGGGERNENENEEKYLKESNERKKEIYLLTKKVSILESYINFLHEQLNILSPSSVLTTSSAPSYSKQQQSFATNNSPLKQQKHSTSKSHPSYSPSPFLYPKEVSSAVPSASSSVLSLSLYKKEGEGKEQKRFIRDFESKPSPFNQRQRSNSVTTNSVSRVKSSPNLFDSIKYRARHTSTPIFQKVPSSYSGDKRYKSYFSLPNEAADEKAKDAKDAKEDFEKKKIFSSPKTSESRKYFKELTLRSPTPTHHNHSKDIEEEFYKKEEFEEIVTVEEETIMFKKRKPIPKELTPKVTEVRPQSANGSEHNDNENTIDMMNVPAGVPTFIDDPADNGSMTHLHVTGYSNNHQQQQQHVPRPVSPLMKKLSKSSLKRLQDLNERNSSLPPHLRSSYVVEELPGLEDTFYQTKFRSESRGRI